MSADLSEPSLDQYPGYFPAAKPPFWTRPKVGVVASIVGVLLGVGIGGTEADTTNSYSQADIKSAVDSATADLEDELQDQEDQEAALDRVTEQLTEARRDLSEVERQAAADLRRAAADQRKAVKAAVAKERQRLTAAAPPPAPAPAPAPQPANTGGGTDPQFSYCYEANDAGYGNYQQGVDPEYDWYDDNDGDGVVCEF